MTARFTIKALTILAALAAVAPSTQAQYQSKYGVYYKSAGNSYLGGTAYAYGRVGLYESGSYGSANGELLLKGTVNFLKQTKEVAKVSAVASSRGEPNAATTSASFKIDLAGKRVLTRSFTSSGTVARWSTTLKLFPTDIKMAFALGPVTVTVKGNVGIGVSSACTFSLWSSIIGARISGDGRAWAHGNAGVALGIPGASVGVDAIAKFANQIVTMAAGANTRDGLVGSLTYSLQAIVLELKAYVKILWKKWSTTLVTWESALVSRTLFSL